mmetsp:Transcript_52403/g.150227  ORF Transcript_52403/g.150227 Transcript_52403/m.150227 type:complete len:341 (+) Transcript_52403:85-1107(+)
MILFHIGHARWNGQLRVPAVPGFRAPAALHRALGPIIPFAPIAVHELSLEGGARPPPWRPARLDGDLLADPTGGRNEAAAGIVGEADGGLACRTDREVHVISRALVTIPHLHLVLSRRIQALLRLLPPPDRAHSVCWEHPHHHCRIRTGHEGHGVSYAQADAGVQGVAQPRRQRRDQQFLARGRGRAALPVAGHRLLDLTRTAARLRGGQQVARATGPPQALTAAALRGAARPFRPFLPIAIHKLNGEELLVGMNLVARRDLEPLTIPGLPRGQRDAVVWPVRQANHAGALDRNLEHDVRLSALVAWPQHQLRPAWRVEAILGERLPANAGVASLLVHVH